MRTTPSDGISSASHLRAWLKVPKPQKWESQLKLNYSVVSKAAASMVLTGVLAACGGGGGGDATPVAAVPAPTTFTVAGTAATGAVFDKATVTIIASDGTKFGGGATDITGADGSYTITLLLTAKPPFVVQAVRDDKTLVSVVAEAKDTTTNITPVTNLIASRLSTSGDPTKLADEIKNKTATVDAAALKAKVAEVVALIKPLMDAVGDSTDPLNGKFVANGTGADKVLDSLSITITPDSATTVNIAVAVKQKLAEGVDPTVIAFTNTTKPAAAIPAVTATDLVPSGTTPLIADFLQRMTACYALALTDRMTSGGTAAADIVAPACKDIFAGKDPVSYKHNGGIVSSKQAFSGIFGSAGTGVKFDRGSYEFTRSNGDLVIAYRATDSSGNVTNNALVVKADTDGKLRAIGNQYKYNGGVSAYQQLRTFVNQTGADYYSTGYTLNVNNTLNAGSSIFAKVVVTTPKGGTLTLKPSAGSSYLPLVKTNSVTGAETITGTNFLRLRSVYSDAANSAKDPATADTNLFFASDKTIDDAYLAAIPAQANWKFEYYLASNPTVVDATQYYKTRARAMTIAELKTQPLANVVDAALVDVRASTVADANGNKYIPTDTPPDLPGLDWVVPAGALAPTSIQVYGNASPLAATPTIRPLFNDSVTVASTARTGLIPCSPASNADLHCTTDGHFAAGGRINGAHLWASDATGREFAHFYAIYTITP